MPSSDRILDPTTAAAVLMAADQVSPVHTLCPKSSDAQALTWLAKVSEVFTSIVPEDPLSQVPETQRSTEMSGYGFVPGSTPSPWMPPFDVLYHMRTVRGPSDFSSSRMKLCGVAGRAV
ncbi:hypothetical protein AQI95_44060 [Streptomyces yokosukanensis]|uniref:Uncharacterized protein n=1 Tax=Streptomyces yokosukanensis TaxID=67386 RepID=A0A101NGA3_9ACTN|nr:hypothetical protein AQI95_44060 [Streptomyces yokosukanensis]OIJ86109.1 hypothetical protein BIV25_42205 [Streptomyces sp. MUSC 14]